MKVELTGEEKALLKEALQADVHASIVGRTEPPHLRPAIETIVGGRLQPVLELAAQWECEPPDQHPQQYLHRQVCPACSRADSVRSAIGIL